ncbi:MAG: acyltransferase [Acidobacteriaceae bacterium]
MAHSLRGNTQQATVPRHIPELDGFRGIAALAVFCNHIFVAPAHPAWFTSSAIWLYHISRYGQYGVDLFFVLSGYLITSILLKDRDSPDYYYNFYWKRALRILPLYLVSLLVAWLWFGESAGGVIISVFFLANFSRLFHVALSGPYWTLAIEEQFYLIWPQFVRRLRIAQVEKWAWAIVIIEPVLRLIDSAFHHSNFFFTFFRCDGLAFGALLACQLAPRQDRSPDTRRLARKRSAIWILGFSCILMLATGKFIYSHRYAPQAIALFISAINLFFYCAIRIAVENSGARFLAVFRSRLMVFFGLISYCLYMSQTYILRTYDEWRHPFLPDSWSGYWVRIAIVLPAAIAVCVVSRYALELPFMSLRKYVLRRRPTLKTAYASES